MRGRGAQVGPVFEHRWKGFGPSQTVRGRTCLHFYYGTLQPSWLRYTRYLVSRSEVAVVEEERTEGVDAIRGGRFSSKPATRSGHGRGRRGKMADHESIRRT